jgi:hypothetical protein
MVFNQVISALLTLSTQEEEVEAMVRCSELVVFGLLSLRVQILVPKYFQCMGQFPGTLGDTFLVSLLSGHAD